MEIAEHTTTSVTSLFNIDIVDRYITDIKKAGRVSLSAFFLKNNIAAPNWEYLSLPFSCWSYFRLKRDASVEEIKKVLEADIERSEYIIGNDITRSADSFRFESLEPLLKKAQSFIRAGWPEMDVLASRLLVRISPIPSQKAHMFESISDPTHLGEVYFNMGRKTPIGWAEIIVHELTHQYLFIVFSKRSFHAAVNWAELSYSSIRREQRPLIGVLHGVLSQASMLYFAMNLLLRPDLCVNEMEERQSIIDQHADGFISDSSDLNRRGLLDLDPSVRTLCDQTQRMLTSLKYLRINVYA